MMKNKSILSFFALAGVLNFQGCSNDVEDLLNEGRTNNEGRANAEQLPTHPATLIKKDLIGQRSGAHSLFFFDLDGNPNTTELVMRKTHCCLSMSGKLNDIKIGETKTIQEWYNQITRHKGCTSNYYRRFKADVKLLDR